MATFEIEREQHLEVHKFRTGAVTATVLLALVGQAFLLPHIWQGNIVELPLLVTIYFSLSRRNPSSGTLLGMTIGVLQDSLGRTPIGLYGIAKTLVGFVASSLGSRIDVEHPLSRFVLTFAFFFFHHSVFVFTEGILLSQRDPYFTTRLLVAGLVNAALGMALIYPLLDRLRTDS